MKIDLWIENYEVTLSEWLYDHRWCRVPPFIFPSWWEWTFRPVKADWPWIGVIACRIVGHGKLESGESSYSYDEPPDPYTYCTRCGDEW